MGTLQPLALFAFGPPNHPPYLFALTFIAGVCFIYADNKPTRVGGFFLAWPQPWEQAVLDGALTIG